MSDEVILDDGRVVKLGARTGDAPRMFLKFEGYFDESKLAVTLPETIDYAAKAMPSINRMYANDRYGCCVWSGLMHQLGIWSGNDNDSGGIVLATDQEVVSQYQQVCGPGDNGCNIGAVQDYARKNGVVAGGKRYYLDGSVGIKWTDQTHVKVALNLFGSLTLGINIPSAWTSAKAGSLWDVTNTRIVGGHDVCCCGYNSTGVVISSWGALYTITWAAFTSRKWLSECYARLAPLWYGNDMLAPCGVNATQLKTDLKAFAEGRIPDIAPERLSPGLFLMI